nr:transposase family protein [Pseudonocardia sp. H11422]
MKGLLASGGEAAVEGDLEGVEGGFQPPHGAHSGKHKCHGVNMQVIADPAGRLIWVSPTLPGARHGMGAAREHGILDAIEAAGLRTLADTAYQGTGPTVRVPQRRRRLDPDTGRCRRTRRRSTPPTPANADPASGPTPRSRTGGSSARSAPAPAEPSPSSRSFRR